MKPTLEPCQKSQPLNVLYFLFHVHFYFCHHIVSWWRWNDSLLNRAPKSRLRYSFPVLSVWPKSAWTGYYCNFAPPPPKILIHFDHIGKWYMKCTYIALYRQIIWIRCVGGGRPLQNRSTSPLCEDLDFLNVMQYSSLSIVTITDADKSTRHPITVAPWDACFIHAVTTLVSQNTPVSNHFSIPKNKSNTVFWKMGLCHVTYSKIIE